MPILIYTQIIYSIHFQTNKKTYMYMNTYIYYCKRK